MKNIHTVILAVCIATLGCVAAVAQTDNTSYGSGALTSNGGYYNSAFGAFALSDLTFGGGNSAFGSWALFSDTTGAYNTSVGYYASYSNTTGSDNTSIGPWALEYNTTGGSNTAVGIGTLIYNTTGNSNIGIGYFAGYTVTGNNNIEIGNYGTSSDSSVTRIGTSGNQTSFYAAGINGVGVSGGVPVYINSNGQLGTVNSSIRFKEDVRDMGNASSRIFLLRPVTYRYKQAYADGSKPIDYGLIPEEVAKVYPDMVVKGADGQIQTVQYQKLTPMLLNEVQKQHQVLEQQQQTIAQQGESFRQLKEKQTATIDLLERRLAALEAAQTASDPAARHAAE
jgi:polyhydroxyalkanoate synthesis regulator phasin